MSDSTATAEPTTPATAAPPPDPDLTAERRDEQERDSATVFPPLPGTFTLPGTDLDVRVRRIFLVEFMALMNVLNVGLGGGIHQVRISTDSPEVAAAELAGLALLAIPRATPEFLVFLTTITEPVESNRKAEVARYWNSGEVEPEVMLDVFERLAQQEAPHVVALAGKVQAMWTRLGRVFGGIRQTKTTS